MPGPNLNNPPPGVNIGGPGGSAATAGGMAGPIGMAAGAGLDVLGSIMQSGAANQAANRQWQLIQSELARRNAIQGGLAPGLMTSAGVTDPTQRAAMAGAISGGTVGEGGAGGQQPSVTSAHMLPGRAHINANDIVQKVDNPFGQAMAQISSGRGGGLKELQDAYNAYLQGIQNFTQSGGANAKVAHQSLSNPDTRRTFETLWQQLGGGQAPILGQPLPQQAQPQQQAGQPVLGQPRYSRFV